MGKWDEQREREGELGRRIAGGGAEAQAAIEELYELLWPQIRGRIGRVLTRGCARAGWLEREDVEQEAYIVFRELVSRWVEVGNPQLPLGGFVVKWLPVYLGHYVRSLTHDRAARREVEVEGEVEAMAVDEVDELVRTGRVRRVLSYLPPLEEAIMLLHHFHEWPLCRVAEALSLSERGVGEAHREGLEQVRRLLLGEEELPPPGGGAGCKGQVEVFLAAAAAHPEGKLPAGRECPALGLPSRFPRAVRPLLKRLGITRDDAANRPAYLAVTLAEALERLPALACPVRGRLRAASRPGRGARR
jgi:RNA polymerase sigma factor (sigma-70 family)